MSLGNFKDVISGITGSVKNPSSGGAGSIQDQIGNAIGPPTPAMYDINKGAFTNTDANDKMRMDFANALNGVNGRGDPTMQAATIATGPQNQSRAMQMQLARALQMQAAGKGPSLADAQMKVATDRGLAQAQGMAQAQTGLSSAQRARMALQGGADARMSANQNAVQGRLAEQLNAQQQLGGALAGMRGQDIGLATSQAGFQQGANQANLGAGLQAQGMRDNMTQFYNQGMMGLNAQDQNRLMELERLGVQQQGGLNQLNSQNWGAQMGMASGFFGGLGQAAPSLIAMSDKNLKTDIKDADSKVLDFVKALKAEEYSYKDGKHGKGKYVSPMAQDLEKTEIGKSMVINTKEGKMVDYARAAGTYLSAASALNRKIDKLESRFAQALKDKGVA